MTNPKFMTMAELRSELEKLEEAPRTPASAQRVAKVRKEIAKLSKQPNPTGKRYPKSR
jgi:hypothetical protein